MVDVRVQIPLDALCRMWESLAIRQLGVLEIVGSNPTILTGMPGSLRETRLSQPPNRLLTELGSP